MNSKNSLLKHFDFTLTDLLCLSTSFFIACLIKLDGFITFPSLYLRIYVWIIITSFIYTVLFVPYKNILRRDITREIRCSVIFVIFNAVSVIVLLYMFKIGANYSRMQLVYTNIFYFISSVIFREAWKRHLIKEKKENKINVFVISELKDVNSVIYNIENSEFSEYQIKGIYVNGKNEKLPDIKYKTYTNKDNLFNAISECGVTEVISFCKPNKIKNSVIEKIVNEGIDFHISIDKIFDFEPDNEEISNLAMYRTLNYNVFTFSSIQRLYDPIKRFLDIIISLIACIFLVPLYVVIKIFYLIDNDNESILYTHTRVGKNGKEFKLYKFRSMIPDADKVLKELLKDKDRKKEWEENHKFDDDPRITKIGNFIRKTSLDEFPQFINVLKGDMSIIGPRPLVPGELEAKNGLKLYERVKPGITGWWACNGRSSISYEERLELEYYYVKNYSLGLDVTCVLKTIYVVLFRKGAK